MSRSEEPVLRSVILDTVGRLAFHTVWAFSLYLLFAGHNAPGGGFVGGLVGGVAFVLVYAGSGTAGLRSQVTLRPEMLLGSGLLLAGGTGAAAWLAGGDYLESGIFDATLPVLGDVKATSALFFDIGVYLVVVGLVLGALATLGAEARVTAEPREVDR